MRERKCKYYMFTDKKTGRQCIVAVTRSCGMTIRGVASCSLEDVYDEEKGKAIARAKCEIKIKKIRADLYRREYNYALECAKAVSDRARDLSGKLADAVAEYECALADLTAIVGD